MKKVCVKHDGIVLELTAPNTPQMNGVVERRISVLAARANAMMIQAGLDEDTRGILWAEAVDNANDLENITATTKSGISRHATCVGSTQHGRGMGISSH
jgi:hypothetical protein